MLTRDKNRLQLDNLRMSAGQWLLSKKVAATVGYAVFTLTPNMSNLIVTNPVLGKNLEHPRLTK